MKSKLILNIYSAEPSLACKLGALSFKEFGKRAGLEIDNMYIIIMYYLLPWIWKLIHVY